MEYLIPKTNLEKLQESIRKLNRRAEKLGCELIEFRDLGEVPDERLVNVPSSQAGVAWIRYIDLPSNVVGSGVTIPVHRVEIDGKAPSLGGWHFVASLEVIHTDDGVENYVRNAPGETCPESYRHKVGTCDHCKAVRDRKETFVLRHDNGSYVAVGRQCIKDFLAFHRDPSLLASIAEILFSCQALASEASKFDGHGYGLDSIQLLRLLAITVDTIKELGWVRRATERETLAVSTATTVSNVIFSRKPCRATSEKADAKAEQVVEWALGLAPENDYLANCNLLARAGYCTRKSLGLAVSMVKAFDHAESHRLENAERTALAGKSEYQGVVGRRQVFSGLRCEKIILVNGQYGSTGIHKLVDGSGNQFTWFASGSTEWMREGDVADVTGTVKSHEEYKGVKQTVLTRCKVKALAVS